jgi:catechol 2,3-dioxygenase-like lactoylglutathione lyase family enzyme
MLSAMLRIGSVVLNVKNAEQTAEFWREALGYRAAPASPDFLVDGQGDPARYFVPSTGPRLHLDRGDRMHLDLWVDSAQEQRAEVERLVGLGARLVEWDYPADADFVVLADPSGNLFCIVNVAE